MTYANKLAFTIAAVMICELGYGQTIEESQALDLGTIAIIDNTYIGTINISKEGVVSKTGGIGILRYGSPALFQVRGFDSNRRLYISVQANQSGTVTNEVSAEQFTVQSYDSSEYITTNEQGDAEFSVGAIFATSGSGSSNFRDTVFSAAYAVTVNY